MQNIFMYIAQVTNCDPSTAVNENTGGSCLTTLPTTAANQNTLSQILGVLFGVLAAIAVLMIVIQGIKFALTQGDPQKAADARKAVIYAVVGLVVSLSAEMVTRLVISRL